MGLDETFDEPAPRAPVEKKALAASKKSKNAKRDPADSDAESEEDGESVAEDEEDDEAGYEFRLFSTSDVVGKVVLNDEEEFAGDGDFVAKRQSSYYLATNLDPKLKDSYAAAAIAFEDLTTMAKQRCWGLELPWKVTQIKAKGLIRTGKDGSVTVESNTNDEDRKKRPGKKKRFKMRKRERAKKDKVEKAAQQATEKEEHIKDKKKRMNRLKKLRRRAKEREKKGGEKGEDDGKGNGEDGSGDDSDGTE